MKTTLEIGDYFKHTVCDDDCYLLNKCFVVTNVIIHDDFSVSYEGNNPEMLTESFEGVSVEEVTPGEAMASWL